jgi:hypothetical protein
VITGDIGGVVQNSSIFNKKSPISGWDGCAVVLLG